MKFLIKILNLDFKILKYIVLIMHKTRMITKITPPKESICACVQQWKVHSSEVGSKLE